MNKFEFQIFSLERQHQDLKTVISLAKILLGEKLPLDISHVHGWLIIPAYRKITVKHLKELVKYRHFVDIDSSPIRNKIMEILHNK